MSGNRARYRSGEAATNAAEAPVLAEQKQEQMKLRKLQQSNGASHGLNLQTLRDMHVQQQVVNSLSEQLQHARSVEQEADAAARVERLRVEATDAQTAYAAKIQNLSDLCDQLIALADDALRLPRFEDATGPRMADFAHLGVAIERALGWEAGSFMRAYTKHITSAVQETHCCSNRRPLELV